MPSESVEQGTIRYIRCLACGAPNPASEAICGRCGKALNAVGLTPPRPSGPQVGQVTCPRCGKAVTTAGKFCGFCGAPLQAEAPSAAQAPNKSPAPIPPGSPKSSIPSPEPAVPSSEKIQHPIPTPTHPPVASTSPVSQPSPSSAVAGPEATQVFKGFRLAKVEASITEVKPDGGSGQSVVLTRETLIGRRSCDLSYPSDSLLSEQHASLGVHDAKVFLKDLGSQNGTFVKQRQDTELAPGDVFLLGRELFRFATQSLDDGQNRASAEATQVMTAAPKLQRGPVTAKLEHIQLAGEVVEEFKLEKPETTLGRTSGDLVFRNDPYMSGTHARIVAQPGRFILQDLNSRNGVYRRIQGAVELRDNDEFFLGEQLFRVSVKTL